MRVVLQRVTEASVRVHNEVSGAIKNGLLVLAGFEENDALPDLEWISRKIVNLRIFADEQGVMNLSCADTSGEILVVSQFTLHASTQKGNRPSYIRSAKPDVARKLYEAFLRELETRFGKPVQKGIFGADMKVSLVNDGPVTIIIDSRNRE